MWQTHPSGLLIRPKDAAMLRELEGAMPYVESDDLLICTIKDITEGVIKKPKKSGNSKVVKRRRQMRKNSQRRNRNA